MIASPARYSLLGALVLAGLAVLAGEGTRLGLGASLLLVPLVVVPSRLYQGAHHPTDVLTSVVFASIWVAVVARVLLPPAPRRGP